MYNICYMARKNSIVFHTIILCDLTISQTLILCCDTIILYRKTIVLRGHAKKKILIIKKNQWVFVKHYSMPPAATKSKTLFFSFKVKVKVTMSLTLVSFERASLVEYAFNI